MEDKDYSRTVVVAGVPDDVLPVSRTIDKLTIHFQSRRRSHGGDVEEVTYPTNMDGVAFIAFNNAEDAKRVVRKEQQIMMDSEFPEDCILTVFPFSRDVFLYVPKATVDLSVFGGDQASLIESLRLAHRSVRFQPLSQQRKASIEGPFTAVQALRVDLIHRASRLKSSDQTAAIKLRETPLNIRVMPHHDAVRSKSRAASKAEQEPTASSSLLTSAQSIGEASDVQSPLSKARTRKDSLRQRVSESLIKGSGDSDEEDNLRAQDGLKMFTECRTDSIRRQVVGEESNAGIISSLSGLDLLLTEDISAKQQGEDDDSEKYSKPHRISAAKTRGEHNFDSGYLKNLSSSAIDTDFPQAGLKDFLTSSEGEGTKKQWAVCPEDPQDIWVDSYTFTYIKKFHRKELSRCLGGVNLSTERFEGGDLMRLSLTKSQTSGAASAIWEATEKLETLMEFWQSTLRVHKVFYDKTELHNKRKLTQICEDVNFTFKNVLYTFEDSYIKVIGPSIFSHLFCCEVEDRIAKLNDTFVKSLRRY